MNELVREIEEDIRRERIDKLWNSFGKMMVGVSVAIVVFTIAFVVMQDRRLARENSMTGQMLRGVDRLNIEDYKGAIPIFEALSADPSSSYYGPAMLRKAQAQIALGQGDEAKKTYAALAAHDATFGPLGKVLSYGGSVEQGDTLAQPEQDSPLYYTGSEFRAWQLLQQGKKDEAVALFLTLYKDTSAPASMHDRLLEALQHVAPGQLTEKTLETPKTTKDAPHE